MPNDVICFKVYGLAENDKGEKDFAGIKTNILLNSVDVEKIKQGFADLLKVNINEIILINEDEYERDYGYDDEEI